MSPTEQLNDNLAEMETSLLLGARSIPAELRSCYDLLTEGAVPAAGTLLGILKKLKGAGFGRAIDASDLRPIVSRDQRRRGAELL